MMLTLQQRRERMNRQISERLKTLIAAYRILGGSFTGQLTVDLVHLHDLRVPGQGEGAEIGDRDGNKSSDRSRRIRDAVEAALADIILLGTEEHVRLADQAASDIVAGRPIHTAYLVAFIRAALDLGPIPDDANIPLQGPTRAQGSGGRGKGDGGKASNKNPGGGGSGAGGGGMGPGLGMGRNDNDPRSEADVHNGPLRTQDTSKF